MYKYLLVIVVFASFVFAAKAQTIDTAGTKKNNDPKVKQPGNKPSGSFAPKINPATEKIYHPDSLHSPHKAVMHSLMIPGWGQVYNHRWWKTPFIYAGLGLLGNAIITNQRDYKVFLALSRYRERGTPPTPSEPYYAQYNLYADLQDNVISDARENSRRNRDISILSILAVWGVQAIDAYIDAKFIHSYTVDNNLSFKAAPAIINQPVYAQSTYGSYIPGIKFTFTF